MESLNSEEKKWNQKTHGMDCPVLSVNLAPISVARSALQVGALSWTTDFQLD